MVHQLGEDLPVRAVQRRAALRFPRCGAFRHGRHLCFLRGSWRDDRGTFGSLAPHRVRTFAHELHEHDLRLTPWPCTRAGRTSTGWACTRLPLDLSHEPAAGHARRRDVVRGDGDRRAPDDRGRNVYARLWNPTVARFEPALARLEHAGGRRGVLLRDGRVDRLVLAVRGDTAGRHVWRCGRCTAGPTTCSASGMLDIETRTAPPRTSRGRCGPTPRWWCGDPREPDPGPRGRPRRRRGRGWLPVRWTTRSPPRCCRTRRPSARRCVLHSATKYLGGHGDVVGGVVATEERAGGLRRVRAVTGGILHPWVPTCCTAGWRPCPPGPGAADRGAARGGVARWAPGRGARALPGPGRRGPPWGGRCAVPARCSRSSCGAGTSRRPG